MKYSEVIPALESGKRIARKSWHLKGGFRKYLFLSAFSFDMFPRCRTYDCSADETKQTESSDMESRRKGYECGRLGSH